MQKTCLHCLHKYIFFIFYFSSWRPQAGPNNVKNVRFYYPWGDIWSPTVQHKQEHTYISSFLYFFPSQKMTCLQIVACKPAFMHLFYLFIFLLIYFFIYTNIGFIGLINLFSFNQQRFCICFVGLIDLSLCTSVFEWTWAKSSPNNAFFTQELKCISSDQWGLQWTSFKNKYKSCANWKIKMYKSIKPRIFRM